MRTGLYAAFERRGKMCPVTARAAQWLRLGLGFAISGVALLLVARRVDWIAVGDAVAHVRWWPWLPIAVAAYLLGHVLRGVRSRYLVSPWADLTTLTAANIVAAGYASNDILPARLGELVRAALLADETGFTLPVGVSVVVVERLLDAVAILILLLGGVALADTRTPLGRVSSRLVALAIGVLAALVAAVSAPELTRSGAMRVARLGRGRARDALLRWITEIASGVALVRHPQRMLTAIALSVAVWVAESGLFLFLLPAVGLDARASVALVALGITNLGILVPSTPGYIGTFDYFASQSLMLFGVAAPTAIAYAVVVHLAFFIPVTLWGLAVLAWYGFIQWRVAALARQAHSATAVDLTNGIATVAVVADRPPEDARFGALLRSLVDAFIPWPRMTIEPAGRAAVLDSTTQFVVGQIRALPVRLRVLFSIGMIGFRIVVRATTGRGFCDLDLERRQRIVRAWAFGPVAPARQLLRVVRSTALLAFWESPAARTALTGRVPR